MFGKTTPQPSPSLSAPPQGSEFIDKSWDETQAGKEVDERPKNNFLLSESVRRADGRSLSIST
jgi:hypothetical protein